MVVATNMDTKPVKTVNDEKKLPMRNPVVLKFKPDTRQKLIDAAVDEVLSKRFTHK